MNTLVSVINKSHKIFAKFYWANTTGAKNKDWFLWKNMCFPKEEGGIGFRSLYVVSKALFCKQWWNFRTTSSSMRMSLCEITIQNILSHSR